MEQSELTRDCGCGHHEHHRQGPHGAWGPAPWRHHPAAEQGDACACGCEDADHAKEGCSCACHEHEGAPETCTCGREEAEQAHETCTCGCHEGALQGHNRHGGCHADGPRHFRRRFITREERIAILAAYLEALRLEAKGVEERIADLGKGLTH